MAQVHTPEEVAASIKEIIKQKHKSLTAYAHDKNITPTPLYGVLHGKEYLSLFAAFRFNDDFDISIDYCTKGVLPVLSPNHNYNVLLESATQFYFAVRDEDKMRDEYERKYDAITEDERARYKRALDKLRLDKAKAGCSLVDLLNIGWAEENSEEDIEKPILPHSTMKLHEAIQEVIRQSCRPLTYSEIAQRVNQQGLYSRKDGRSVPASQISARVKNYPALFTVNNEASPATVTLI